MTPSKPKLKSTLLLLVLNEEIGMRAIMPRVKPEWVDQILVVDGGSTDGTVEYARSQGYEVLKQKAPGLINAQREAYPHIKGDIVITFSPDGNSIPELIPQLNAEIEKGADMVTASRYLKHKISEDDTYLTSLGNRFFTGLINFLFNGNFTDCFVIYRAYRKTAIQKMGLLQNKPYSIERFCPRLYDWDTISHIRTVTHKLKSKDIDGPEPARIGGKSKLDWKRVPVATFSLLLILNEFLLWKISSLKSPLLKSTSSSH